MYWPSWAVVSIYDLAPSFPISKIMSSAMLYTYNSIKAIQYPLIKTLKTLRLSNNCFEMEFLPYKEADY